MTKPLSPAAQAVLDATYQEIDYVNYLHIRWATIAALRAVADQVVPAEDEDVYFVPWNLTEHMRQRQDTRRKILAITKELEAQ